MCLYRTQEDYITKTFLFFFSQSIIIPGEVFIFSSKYIISGHGV